MELEIVVRASGKHFRGGAAIVIDEPLVGAFEPLNICDDRMIAYATGEHLPFSAHAKKKIKLREEAAKEIAEALTRHLINEMKKHDTYNGYSK